MFTFHLSLCRDSHSEKAGEFDLLKTLTEAGADLNVQGGAYGWSPIMKAANDGKIRIVIVRFLKDKGVDLDLRDLEGKTARDLAEEQNNNIISNLFKEK